MGKLSNIQQKKLGGLLAINEGNTTHDEIIEILLEKGFIEKKENGFQITDLGSQEKRRLTILAGLMMEKN